MAPMSWVDAVDFVSVFVSRHVKLLIGLTFAVLMVLVPPARAAVAAFGEAVIRDTSASLSRQLMPALRPLATAPATRG